MQKLLSAVFLFFCLSQAQGATTPCLANDAAGHACENIDLLSHLSIAEMGGDKDVNDAGQPIEWVSDMWGWVDDQGTPEATDDREYAIVGRFCGTSFIDITDPEAPVYLGNLPDHSEFETGFNDCVAITGEKRSGLQQKLHETDGSIWRDIKVYGHYALIVAETNIHADEPRAGMQIFDLHQLRGLNPAALPVAFGAASYLHYSGFGNAHNVFVNQLTGIAYGAGTDQCDGGPHMVDISDPANPVEAGCYGALGYTHDIQCVIYTGPDDAHVGKEICFGSNGNASGFDADGKPIGPNTLAILDTSNPANVVQIANAPYINAAYSHQGWLSEDQRYFFHNDELDEYYAVFGVFGTPNPIPATRLLVWDVSDLDNPVLVTEFFGRTGSTDHNNYVQGDFLYQSNYTAGLDILDISDPENPAPAGYFDNFIPYDVADYFSITPDTSDDEVFLGTWSNYPWYPSGTVAISDISGGLYLVKPNFTTITSANTNVSVRALDDDVEEGEEAAFELLVANLGPDTSTGLTAVFKLDNGTVQDIDADAGLTCNTPSETVVLCKELELVAADDYVVEITTVAGTAGTLSATAYSTAHDVDSDSMDNTDQATVTVKAKPDDDQSEDGGGSAGLLMLAGLLTLGLLRRYSIIV